MTLNSEYFLKKSLGEDFFESLSKTEIWKPGTKSVIDTEDMRIGLKIVPRTVMAFLIRELVPMLIGQNKRVVLQMSHNAFMNVTKHERDQYSGEVEHNGKKITEFKFRSLPGLGLVLMSTFELYSVDDLDNPGIPEVSDDVDLKVQKLIDERLALHDLISQVVDRKIEQKHAVNNLMLMKLTEELAKEKAAAEQARVQLAGCGVAALGYPVDVKPGDYGHSASLEDVKKIRKEKDELEKKAKQIAEVRDLQEKTTPQSDEYFRGMTNGLEVANATINNKEPKFVEHKKSSPVKDFLEKRQSKKEFVIQMAKGEVFTCPDCRKDIFDGKVFSSCICLGADMDKKVFIKKSENGIKVRFSRGWDEENIEMLLDVLQKKNK